MTAGAWLVLALFVPLAWRRINAEPRWRALALLLALVFSLAHQLAYSTVPGEAYVAFRYAVNTAEGFGPVFNPGERVEGYSSFLWMIALAFPKALFGVNVQATAVTLGVACTLGSVLLAYFVVNRIVRLADPEGPGLPALGVAAAVLTAGVGSVAAYGAAGLETPLFVLLVLAVCGVVVARRPVVAGVFVALAMMTRPEGAVLAITVGVWLLLAALRRWENGWAPAGYALSVLVVVVPWTAWRVTYYGYLLPNTVAARPDDEFSDQLSRGWGYLSGFAVAHQVFLLLGVAAVAALVHRRRVAAAPPARARSLVWLTFVLAVGFVVLAVLAGGGGLPAWRLLAVVPPLLACAAAAAFGIFVTSGTVDLPSPVPRARRLERRRVPAAVTVGMCGLSLLVSLTHPAMLSAMHAVRDRTGDLVEIGNWLGEQLPAGSVVGARAAGPVGYAAPRLTVIDLQGRADEFLARAAGTDDSGVLVGGDYVVNVRRPAVAVTVDSYGAEQRCGADPTYAGLYLVANFRHGDSGEWVTLYLRRNQASSLVEALDADPAYAYEPCAAEGTGP